MLFSYLFNNSQCNMTNFPDLSLKCTGYTALPSHGLRSFVMSLSTYCYFKYMVSFVYGAI